MASEEFKDFRLVGGTALGLQIGHRKSIDIDLFSDIPYGTMDFEKITGYLESNFTYLDYIPNVEPGLGKSYFVGETESNSLKLDVFYTDDFIRLPFVEDGIRMANIEDIIAMKLDVVQRGARKKDFWDLHALFESYGIGRMLQLHKERYPYSHDEDTILKNFIDFSHADDDFDPICLLGKYWEFIKEDLTEYILNYKGK
jgi:hypothetical protein